MFLTRMKVVMVVLAATALAACGREQSGSPNSVEAGKGAAKADAKAPGKIEDAPRIPDPTKDGY